MLYILRTLTNNKQYENSWELFKKADVYSVMKEKLTIKIMKVGDG